MATALHYTVAVGDKSRPGVVGIYIVRRGK
jgi:hypothetical protein